MNAEVGDSAPLYAHIEPCDWTEPHENHVKPGALRNTCLGLAPEYPSEKVHTAACANRRLTDRVMGVRLHCACAPAIGGPAQ